MTVEQLIDTYTRKNRVKIRLIKLSTQKTQEFNSMDDMYIADLEQEVINWDITLNYIIIEIRG